MQQLREAIQHLLWFQTCITFSSSALFFRSSSSCFLFNSISAFLKCRERKRFSKAAFPSTSDGPPPTMSFTYSRLSSCSCLRRCSTTSLFRLSFSISSSILFSLSCSSSSCFFFCMEESSCSERFTSPWYSVSISFHVMLSVAYNWGQKEPKFKQYI